VVPSSSIQAKVAGKNFVFDLQLGMIGFSVMSLFDYRLMCGFMTLYTGTLSVLTQLGGGFISPDHNTSTFCMNHIVFTVWYEGYKCQGLSLTNFKRLENKSGSTMA